MTPNTDALRRLTQAPRTVLGVAPTPLRAAPNLRAALGSQAPEIWIKHDDLTGFALGGNKVRKLEYELSPDRIEGVTHLITMGGPQSNHCRVTAAAAARLGISCILVVNGSPDPRPRGNALLHRLYGAEVILVPEGTDRIPTAREIAHDVEQRGGNPLIVPIGASTPRGALGYVVAAAEVNAQLETLGLGARRTTLLVASSSAGTLAGLAAGTTLLSRPELIVYGVSADVPAYELDRTAREIASATLDMLGARVEMADFSITTSDREVGEGYGRSTEESREALHLFARSEGLVLDPTYTAKAAAGLIRGVREGQFERDDLVVFIHTGGHPALLA